MLVQYCSDTSANASFKILQKDKQKETNKTFFDLTDLTVKFIENRLRMLM
jgi:hypothetical protein